MSKNNLEDRFRKAVEIANKMKPLPQDEMLVFYAYYKQATKGDNFSFNAAISMDVRNAFKFNAWQQLRGITPQEAKEQYIELVEKYNNVKI